MSYGFIIRSGTGQIVESISSDRPPGVLLDRFEFSYSTTPTTRSYPNFSGTQILPIIQSRSPLGSNVSVTVNNAAKSFTIVGKSASSDNPANGNVFVIVLGV